MTLIFCVLAISASRPGIMDMTMRCSVEFKQCPVSPYCTILPIECYSDGFLAFIARFGTCNAAGKCVIKPYLSSIMNSFPFLGKLIVCVLDFEAPEDEILTIHRVVGWQLPLRRDSVVRLQFC
jgi:hypothetical protein